MKMRMITSFNPEKVIYAICKQQITLDITLPPTVLCNKLSAYLHPMSGFHTHLAVMMEKATVVMKGWNLEFFFSDCEFTLTERRREPYYCEQKNSSAHCSSSFDDLSWPIKHHFSSKADWPKTKVRFLHPCSLDFHSRFFHSLDSWLVD